MQTRNHAAYSLSYHIILTTKYRRRCINAVMLESLRHILANTCREWRCELVEFSGEADHVHLLVNAHPSLNLADFIANLKSTSSRAMQKEFFALLRKFYWKRYFWSSAYAVASAGGHASIEQLVEYIRNQEQPAA